MKTESITLSESKRLIALEQTIEAGRKTFVEVGLALAEIRDARLYRSDFDTFEAYCQKKWGFTKTYANNLIAGADVVKQLPEKLTTIVVSEGQARELAKVPAEKRVEVLKAAQESGPVTAKTIHEAAAVIVPQTRKEKLAARLEYLGLPPDRDPSQRTVESLRVDIRRLILHRPVRKGPLLAFAKILSVAAKKFKAFAQRAKD
jgi:hypothetical protein